MQPIVLIDDDRDWVQASAELLKGEGFEVRTADDGERGLELVEEARPWLVILDVNLPKLGGLEVLREVRRQEPRLPVIMISADDRSAVMAQAMGQGATCFLRKPVAATLFLRAVRQLSAAEAQSEPSRQYIE